MSERLDNYLVNNGYIETRSKAQSVIMAGCVYIDSQKAMKAGQQIKGGEKIEIRDNSPRYVSRGGLKLEKAMKVFPVSLDKKICMDVGASTGGFTDCMLKNGAARVYAIDVGYGQLAWQLRQDERVVNLERTNFRYVTDEQVPEPIDFFSVDVSFISLALILPPAFKLLKEGGEGVCLIKPQFEAGREKVGKKGVVRDKSVHIEVIEKALNIAAENGFEVLGLDYSPIKGPEGNIEYLMHIRKPRPGDPTPDINIDIQKTVEDSHRRI